jgi:hypothetical protein
MTTLVSGLPPALVGLGGVVDVAFIGKTAYALVTLVGPDVGGHDTVGIYRIDGPTSFTVVADIGAFAIANPPRTPFDVPSGLQFAIDVYEERFLVTDGHHNRLLWATRHGRVSEAIGFDNIVPTGLAVAGRRVFMAEAGAVPHLPEDGKVVALDPRAGSAVEIASGAPLLVDVEFGPRGRLYALSQGVFPPNGAPAAPALPNSGSLVRVRWDGSLRAVAKKLNQPTSMEFVGDTAYIVTLSGEIWTVELKRD